MSIELCSVGGYNEVGKNMTAVKVDDEVVIFDMGIHLPTLINFEEAGGSRENLSPDQLIKLKAIPDDRVIKDWRKKVKAIVVTHCHLDHIAAIPYLSSKYNCPIIGTPYSMEVLKRILRDDGFKIKNELKSLNCNSKIQISKNLEIEFINMTHSTVQTVMIALHTKYGTIVYANDFKFDNHPVVGKKPHYEILERIGKGNVIALVVDSLYAKAEQKTPSEKVAREMLQDVMLGTNNQGKAVIVTTFASHIARLKSIIDFGKRLNRKIVFLGRSLAKYTEAAEKVKIINFSKDVEIFGYRNSIKSKLNKIEREGRDKFLIVCTGNQGEPEAVLTKIVLDKLKFRLLPEDHVIFSCRTIPHPMNVKNREIVENALKKKKVRIFTDIHVSGHAAREDHRDLINMLKPKHIIPAHGGREKTLPMKELATEMGYGKNTHILQNGDKIKLL